MAISIRLLRRFSGSAPVRSNRVWCYRSRRTWLVLSFFVAGGALVHAGGTDEEFARARYNLVQELTAERIEYRVVPGAVVAPSIPESQRSVLGAYVRIVRDIVIDLPTRYLDETERTAIATARLRRQREDLNRRIDDRLREIDREQMERETGPDVTPPERGSDARLQQLYDDVDVLDSIGDRAISAFQRKRSCRPLRG